MLSHVPGGSVSASHITAHCFLAAILISLVVVALINVPGNGCCYIWTRRMFRPTVAVTRGHMEAEVSTEYVQRSHVMHKGPNY